MLAVPQVGSAECWICGVLALSSVARSNVALLSVSASGCWLSSAGFIGWLVLLVGDGSAE